MERTIRAATRKSSARITAIRATEAKAAAEVEAAAEDAGVEVITETTIETAVIKGKVVTTGKAVTTNKIIKITRIDLTSESESKRPPFINSSFVTSKKKKTLKDNE